MIYVNILSNWYYNKIDLWWFLKFHIRYEIEIAMLKLIFSCSSDMDFAKLVWFYTEQIS